MNDERLAERLPLDEHAGPAPRLPKDRAAAMIAQALDEGYAVLPPPAAVRASRSPIFMRLSVAAGVLLALAGSAFAARRYWVARESAASAPAAHAAKPAHAKPHHEPPPPSAAAPEPEPEPVLEPEQEPTPLATPTRAERRSTHELPRDVRDVPEDLLQAANRLRAEGRFAAAADVYGLVYERHPRSISAYVARVARASIELEHLNDPRLARALFSKALRSEPGGALDIEARQGLALALRDLGDTAAESSALRELIAAHPTAPAAERARARLRELPGAH
jgi:tetratricopeptide (TPR) repeat protein